MSWNVCTMETFQGCFWLIVRHFKLKLQKMLKCKIFRDFAPLPHWMHLEYIPNPQLFSQTSFTVLLGLAMQLSQKKYDQKNCGYCPVGWTIFFVSGIFFQFFYFCSNLLFSLFILSLSCLFIANHYLLLLLFIYFLIYM